MLYAKVILGLPVEGPFDYLVPENLREKIKIGCRVTVPFGNFKKVGYVVNTSNKTEVKNLKSILGLLDQTPLLNKNLLLLTKKISEYYCCSWGQALETALPDKLRKGKILPLETKPFDLKKESDKLRTLAHCLDANEKWTHLYFNKIKEVISLNKSVIVLLPDIPAILKAENLIKANFNCPIAVLYRKHPDELKNWIEIKNGKISIVIGTRSAIFAPLDNLGLIIIDEEEAYAYKQDQVPHYNARVAGLMRADIDKAELILESHAPSLESVYLAKKNKIDYLSIPRKTGAPEIKISDMKGLPLISARKNIILSKYLTDSIVETLNSKGKILLFLNRSGFATFSFCFTCGAVLKCQRCNINLVFHYKENILSCHYCNFKMEPPKICPSCNSGYIRYSGAGTEKIESELSRLFPQARVRQLDIRKGGASDDADIFISGQSILRESDLKFDLIGVLAIDSSLNYVDFRSSEKTFNLLSGLSGLTDKKIVIQTSLAHHYVFKSLLNNDSDLFYKEELRQRKDLNFPPYTHLVHLKLRGKIEDKVKTGSEKLFNDLSALKDKEIEIISVNPANPTKVRGNFCWQILIRSKSPIKLSGFLKRNLKKFKHSGIIVTVDVDPV